jgi:hypothetical protein
VLGKVDEMNATDKRIAEPTRTRKHGTKVTKATTGEAIVKACRDIVERKQYAKISGLMMDLFSASTIVAVYDALKPENRVKFCAFGDKGGPGLMADVALKVSR